jgi:chaperonin GroES
MLNRGSEIKPECLTIKSYKMSEVKIKPLADRVLVEPQAAEEKTASGIIIPDSAKEKPQKGTVIAVGPGTKDENMEVKKGDTVLYGKYSGTELTVNGKDYLIMRQSDILAVI